MLTLFATLAPVFILIGIGYFLRGRRILSDRTGDGLSDYVFTLAVPCLLFRTLAKSDIPSILPWGYWIAYFSAAAAVWLIGMGAARHVFDKSRVAAVTCGFASAQSNAVLIGIPVIINAFGDSGAVPLALLLAIHLPITMTAATLMAEGRAASLAQAVRKLATHPIIIGILLGSMARPLVDTIPSTLWGVVDMIAATAVPCALITLGIALFRYGLEGGVALPSLLAGLKLILHPLLVYMLARHVFDLPPVWIGVAVMLAACPCGINAYLFAERYREGMAEASAAIALSTALSVVTMVGWLALVTL